SARLEPPVVAGSRAQPEFRIVGCSVRPVLIERREPPFPIVRMQMLEERLEPVRKLVVGISEELLVARREIDFAASNVPVPDARIAAIDREIEPLLADLQRVLEGIARAQHAPRKRNASD